MKSRLPLAALLAFLYAPLSHLHLYWHFARTGDPFMMKRLVTSPSAWLTLIGCIVVGIGLRKGQAWAWLCGLLGAGWLLYPRAAHVIENFGHRLPFIPLGITIPMLVIFIILLLTSPPRKIF